MSSQTPVLCLACKRFLPATGTCEAFPKGIPDDILLFGRDHRTSIRGDHGIVFDPSTRDDAKEAFEDWESFNNAMLEIK